MRVEDEPVRRLIRHLPVTVDADTSLRDVAEILAEESIGAALVHRTMFVEGTVSHPEGVISERDVTRAIAAGLDPDTTRAGDVMAVHVATARSDEQIVRVAQRMLANGIRHVPIVENRAVIGVVSERDVLGALVQDIQEQTRRRP